MDIKSVTSGIGAYSDSTARANRTSESQRVEPAENREPRPEDRVERKEESPRPVVNTQGQKTGSLINVTA